MYTTALFLFRIILASICGAAIGYERSNRSKEAGIRTHTIVALSSALMMIISKYGFDDVERFDAARIAAQIVTGVGFLGAGIIFVKNNNVVSGLTTSAGIWATAGVGMSIGTGLIAIGIGVTIIMLFLQIVMHKNSFLTKKEGYRYKICMTLRDGISEFSKLKLDIISQKVFIENVNISRENSRIFVEIDVLTTGAFDKLGLIETLLKYESVNSVNIE